MPSEAAFSLRILILAVVVTIAFIAAIYWLSRKWYIKRNGCERKKSCASRRHLIIRYIFSGLFLAGTFLVNAFQDFFEPSIFIVFLLFYAVYTLISVHMWKQESDNPDDYRYEWFVQGGTLVVAIIGLTATMLALEYV
ncbi:hypothetical protein SAMN05421781_0498 [Marinococcus luteus]|uniref:DUF4181 domain-containing protein n=1 Tax=Marinococcus luteus TaxID=1122204 RepID=A0A1H2QWS5_9BACI|nr:hypothetical protein [Marinococcus luteus]SDW11617.1 hypothetical protein SAMN05421781_0498 [Marinococcus luteus]